MATRIDIEHLRAQWLPRLNALLSSVSFATNRYQVHRVYVCAVILSQDEAEIGHLLETTPSFAVTQEKLDWQPDDDLDDQNEGDVYQHLLRMSASEDRRLRRTHDFCLLGNVTSAGFGLDSGLELCSSPSSKSFRLSSVEIFNAPADEMQGYHIGATAFEKFAALGDSAGSKDQWVSWLIAYIVKLDESPQLVWAQEGLLKTAVLWQVQVDIVDLASRPLPNFRQRPRKRYGTFLQVHVGESSPESRENGAAPEAKRFKCVRWRHERKKWVGEMRLPQVRKDKVTFGEFKSQDQAARAVDAAYYYYGKQEQVQFAYTPQILPELPAGLNEEEKLKFVKSKAKWLALSDPTLLAPVSAQEISGGHSTAVHDLLRPSPPTSTSVVPNTLICSTSDVGGSVEMSLEQSFSNNLEAAAELVEAGMQTMFLDQFSCGMGSGIDDLVYSGSTAPDWFHRDSTLPGFDDVDMDTRLLDAQSLQDLLFQSW